MVGTSSTGVVAVTVATGAKRMIAPFAGRVTSGGEVFLDATHVLWVRIEDRSSGKIANRVMSLHIAGPGPTDDFLLEEAARNTSWQWLAVLPSGVIVKPSADLFVKPDGTVLVASPPTIDTFELLGINPKGTGVIVTSFSGDVREIDLDGTVRELAHTPSWSVPGPLASYTASRAP